MLTSSTNHRIPTMAAEDQTYATRPGSEVACRVCPSRDPFRHDSGNRMDSLPTRTQVPRGLAEASNFQTWSARGSGGTAGQANQVNQVNEEATQRDSGGANNLDEAEGVPGGAEVMKKSKKKKNKKKKKRRRNDGIYCVIL